MIVATLAIAVTSSPPVGEALTSVVLPDEFDFVAVLIIGGTVGGYITYAGAPAARLRGAPVPSTSTRSPAARWSASWSPA